MVIVGASSADTIRTDESRPLLSREKFETSSLAFHDELPVIVEEPSSLIVDHVAPGAAGFIHVDASHLCPRQARKGDRQFRRLSEQIQQVRLSTRLRRRLGAATRRADAYAWTGTS